ncbi:hypothetical protein [Paenibacillus sp. FSL E2-0178]|uniref:hypothetical protein n=1 Tax=Paenibacillus sp. FSL E2-0178 TaxID=2921361 RepID=UPI0031597632
MSLPRQSLVPQVLKEHRVLREYKESKESKGDGARKEQKDLQDPPAGLQDPKDPKVNPGQRGR